MASILRSSKFVRYIAGFARNVVLNTPREFDGTLLNTSTSQCFCGALPRSLASAQHDQNLERSLRRLDQDVRKSGRISRRDIEDVLEEIRSARSATSSQSLLVIRCCGNLVPEELPEVRTKLVQEIWNTLNKLNVPMDISHYNALLRVYLENEHPFSPTDFLVELENKGIEPNRVTYQRLIARYCQVGDIEGATKILEYMREKQLPVNENVFNALIVGHSEAGDMDSAHAILGVMTQAGLEPSADTYTTLLCGYAKKGDIDKINEIIEECETKDVFLLDKDYLDVVYSLAVNGHDVHVTSVLNRVRKAIGYNQDAVNLILRLVNKQREKSALEVLKSMPRISKVDGTTLPTGSFFVKQLVKANRPVETIIEYCNTLETEGMHDRALLLATEASLQLGNEKLAYALLEELQKRGVEIRQHFFWPLIVSKANDATGKGIIDVLHKMNTFNITPNTETIREYVLPNLKGKSSEILATLREANVSVGASACSLVISLLQRNEIDEAAVIANGVAAYYVPEQIKRPLTNAFYKTNDMRSYISVLRAVHDNLNRKKTVLDDETQTIDQTELVGTFVLDLTINQRGFHENIEQVLREIVNQGLSISNSAAERIENKLGGKMTDDVSKLLGKLTSGELIPVPLEKKPPTYVPSHQMTVPQLEKLIENLTKKNQDTKGLKRQLLTLYYRAKELEKTETLLEELSKQDFVFTSGLYAQLLDLYAYHDKLEKSLEYYEKLKENQGEKFALDEGKTIRLAHLLTKNDRFDDAISILENTPRDRKQEQRTFAYSALVWRFLNAISDEGRIDDLNKLFDTLVKQNYIEINNVFLGPLIKVHIVRKELDKALEKFEWCVNEFKATPWKNELACQLIQNEDAEKLQKLTDLSTTVHGEINSLYDLVFAFVECGRIRQARKILETPGLQNRPQRINTICERYQQEGLIKPLEGLKDATRDLNHIDRTDIYYQLLLSYIKQDDPSKALNLWTQMQEEDLAPNERFLTKLGKFLQDRGLNVPFAMPQTPENKPPPTTKQPKRASSTFKDKLTANDLDACLRLSKRSVEKVSVADLSTLIEKLVQNDRLQEATDVAFDLLNKGSLPVNRVFRFLLNRLAAKGDVDALHRIGAKLTQDVKRIVSFDNRICHANLVAGNAEQYLKKLEEDIDNVKDEEVATIGDKFPRGGAYGILERNPELTGQYEKVAVKYAKKGIVAPLNVLWTNYFIKGDYDKADQIWRDYLKDSPRIMFQRIVQTAREQQDENLASKLIEHLKISTVTEGAIGNAYSCLLDILCSKGKVDEVVTTFERALSDVKIDFVNRTAVLRVKEVFLGLGKPFDHPIPPKNKTTKNTSEEV